MKINEITNKQLDEGIWDNIKQGAGTVAGAAKQAGSAVAGAAQKVGQGVQSFQRNRQITKTNKTHRAISKSVLIDALKQYDEFAAPIVSAGNEVSIPQARAWFQKFAGVPPTTQLKGTTPTEIQQWLSKEIPAYMASKSSSQGTGISAGQTVEKDGQQYKWDGAGWRTAKGTYPSAAITQQLTQLAHAQATQPAAAQTNIPSGEAQSPQDVVNRLLKLHPDWIPEITKQLLNKQSVTAGS